MKHRLIVAVGALLLSGANLAFAATSHRSAAFSCRQFTCDHANGNDDCTVIDCDTCDKGGGTTYYCNSAIEQQ